MDNKKEIEKDLISILKQITSEFPDLSARYEYNEDWDTFLVSYNMTNEMISDNLCIRMMELEDELINKYEDAPLFCDNERLFKLSENAIVVKNGII